MKNDLYSLSIAPELPHVRYCRCKVAYHLRAGLEFETGIVHIHIMDIRMPNSIRRPSFFHNRLSVSRLSRLFMLYLSDYSKVLLPCVPSNRKWSSIRSSLASSISKAKALSCAAIPSSITASNTVVVQVTWHGVTEEVYSVYWRRRSGFGRFLDL